MRAWALRAFPRRLSEPEPVDPDAEAAVAERLLPVAREVLVAPAADGSPELLALVERLAPQRGTEVLCPPEVGVELIARLLARGFTVYDASTAVSSGVLVLDRRLGWRVPGWEPLAQAYRTACRLLWTRLGYYTVRAGTVESVHSENRLFSLRGQRLWVNTAYRELPLPEPGARLRVLGLFNFVGTSLPVLHALRIEPVPPEG